MRALAFADDACRRHPVLGHIEVLPHKSDGPWNTWFAVSSASPVGIQQLMTNAMHDFPIKHLRRTSHDRACIGQCAGPPPNTRGTVKVGDHRGRNSRKESRVGTLTDAQAITLKYPIWGSRSKLS